MITFNINEKINADVFYNESLKNRVTFNVGGNCDVLVSPLDMESFAKLITQLKSLDINWFVLGGGSNLVPQDKDFSGIVVSTEKLQNITLEPMELKSINSDSIKSKLVHIDTDTNTDTDVGLNDNYFKIICQAGVKIQDLIDFCIDNELTGLENFAGLPGTVGGAVFMNARCYEKSISDVLLEVEYLESDKIFSYTFNEVDWDYKKSPFQNTSEKGIFNPKKIILSSSFLVKKIRGMKDKIKEKSESFIQDRKDKGHFKYPSAGSVFKNNRNFGKPSGKIIDEAGLRGMKIGNAQIAPWHGNFIINIGDATAQNIQELVNYIKTDVFAKTGFNLECEIIFI